ncbi:FAD-binding protein [Bifidobacterium xylocopae]|uniref:UDP-N-acetylenolpyruvoylglucosamine reductase n=1 Tax=Bifidobacterium xylocopae TaxID=2493119 RepID=A0A366KCF2_9BIFI|nr:FAD-binding protein [Bifidobacterium xylocopae]RBP99374.1 UDP-N-acetylenolpyruvoylglucosamine reductase [Bifidobacterium xylocopae]
MANSDAPTVPAVSFSDLTTIRVGGTIGSLLNAKDRVGIIEAVEGADSAGVPVCVLGGGSNLLASDEHFAGLVVRDARRAIHVLDEAAPVESGDRTVHVGATAGTNWDDLIMYCLDMGLSGVEGLSGIPGTVGASVVQNISAYGQEAAQSVASAEVWDRQEKRTRTLAARDMAFGYRTSLLKASMYRAPGEPAGRFFPTPRYVVLSVTFALRHSAQGKVDSDQLARALGVGQGDEMPAVRIRQAVLGIRAGKGMLEDPARYSNPWMLGCREERGIRAASDPLAAIRPDDTRSLDSGTGEMLNRNSCGSFFTNPVLTAGQAARLPKDAPRFPAPGGPGGGSAPTMIKTSAAWLIDHAGFHKGFALPGSGAALSTAHTLALTNRGTATAAQVVELARTIRDGVRSTYGVELVPEPVLVGLSLD